MELRQTTDNRRIVVIGPCASGKTSLTTRLQGLGYDALACGQEHSEISELWRHRQPDVVVGLRIALDTLRQRRSDAWSEDIYARQMTRLASGYRHADLMIECDAIDQVAVVERVVAWLMANPAPVDPVRRTA
jgi:deoxyadenosine/deoxycytidine kinase